jgi:hypothetical protein
MGLGRRENSESEVGGRIAQALVGGDDFSFSGAAGCGEVQGIVGANENGRLLRVALIHNGMEFQAHRSIAGHQSDFTCRQVALQRVENRLGFTGCEHSFGFLAPHGGPKFKRCDVRGEAGCFCCQTGAEQR